MPTGSQAGDASDRTVIDACRLEEIVGASKAVSTVDELTCVYGADFARATFIDDVDFGGLVFAGRTSFDDAQFESKADFRGALFVGPASFRRARFASTSSFQQTSFQDVAHFSGAEFESGVARFDGAWFAKPVFFRAAVFGRGASFHGARVCQPIRFVDATFAGDADFRATTFDASADFSEATFVGDANFDDAAFRGEATFAGTTFDRLAFEQASFAARAVFRGVSCLGSCWFNRAEWNADADFSSVIFHDLAYFAGARFGGRTTFSGTFSDVASFANATFEGAETTFGGRTSEWTCFGGRVDFARAHFAGEVLFDRASFAGDFDLSGARCDREIELRQPVAGVLRLDRAFFSMPVVVDCSPQQLTCASTHFEAARLCLGGSAVELVGTSFARASVLEPATSTALRANPRLCALDRADVEHLTLACVDLTGCRFAGAYHLDKLRIQSNCAFPRAPNGWRWRRIGRWPWPRWPSPPRYSRRETIIEEHDWRTRQQRQDWLGDPAREALDPGAVASVYRALRKGREDEKYEPGAADFYYGEMEMRRRARGGATGGTPAAERQLLYLYWLLSGYALRTSRALVSLVLVVILSAAFFAYEGFASAGLTPVIVGVTKEGALIHDATQQHASSRLRDAVRALTYSVGTATAIITGPERRLTVAGEVARVMLRIIGPILLALAVLSVRARVKR